MVKDRTIKRSQPAYKQIRDDLLESILNGEILPGESIPSENDLSEAYGVSKLTVRAALMELQRDGHLQSVHGKGVFVIGQAVSRDLDRLTGFTRSMKKLKKDPKNSLINSYIRKAGPFFANLFSISEEDDLHYIKRLSSVDKEALSIEEIYVPTKVLPNLMHINTNDFSMYDIYDYYNIAFTHADQSLEVTSLDQNEARLLGVKKDTPVFLLKCITYADDKPIEYSVSYVNPEKSRFRSEFDKDFWS